MADLGEKGHLLWRSETKEGGKEDTGCAGSGRSGMLGCVGGFKSKFYVKDDQKKETPPSSGSWCWVWDCG